MLDQIQPYLVSFLIGLFIGIDRERSLPPGMKGMGVRTFILIALLGTIVAEMNDVIFTALVSIFVLGSVLSHYLITKGREVTRIGLTTGLAAGAVYCLGYMAPKEPMLSAVVGGAILIILLGRKRLHSFAKEKLQPKEINAAATMVLILMCVLVFLPNHAVDPWGLFNPQRFGLLVAIIAGIQFSGYIAMRIFGDHLGVLFTGFFGGLVSSTAVFATLPEYQKNRPERVRPAAAAGILATVGMLIELTIIMFVAAPELLLAIIAPVVAMILTGVLCAFILFHNNLDKPSISTPSNPLDLKSVFYLALLIAGMLVVVAVAKSYVGAEGAQVVSFLGALFEIHSVSLATATLFVTGKLALVDARVSLLLALLASYITKFVLLWGLARNRFALLTSLMLLVMIAAGVVAVLFTH